MHDATVDAPPNPSMEALELCPEIIRDVMKKLVGQGITFENALAVLLSTAAAAIGPAYQVERRGLTPLAFNVILSHQCPHPASWPCLSISPLVIEAQCLQVACASEDTRITRRRIAAEEHALVQAGRTPNPRPELLADAELQIAWLKAQLEPMIVTHRLRRKEVAAAISRSFDRGLLLTGVANDIGAQFLRLARTDRAELVEHLHRSWRGVPLDFGKSTETGTVSILWHTLVPLDRLIGSAGFDPALNLPPILFLTEKPLDRRIEVSKEWEDFLQALLRLRVLRVAAVYRLGEDAERLLGEYENALEASDHVEHLWWFPDLATRIAALLASLDPSKNLLLELEVTTHAINICKVLASQHLAAIEQALQTAPTDSADRSAVMRKKMLPGGL